ncbi:MAG TPA: hypothetical protein VM511_06885 [Luteolibacter sp.]|nr:hypothetical protein [Luteolibacter sp.]
MKNPSVIARERIRAAKLWVFRWRGLDGTPVRGFLALLITAGLFAIFAATVRIRVSAPQQCIERKASFIHLPSGGDGALWTLRAQEGGPFPSKFDPKEWENAGGLSGKLASALNWSAPSYRPSLRELPPSQENGSLSLAQKSPVFPQRPANVSGVVAGPPAKLVPMVFPLTGTPMASMPAHLPPFPKEIDAAMAAGAWRFLIRLNPSGAVEECVPLLDQKGAGDLASWLRGLNFGADTAKKSPWIGIGLGFTHARTDGSDAR